MAKSQKRSSHEHRKPKADPAKVKAKGKSPRYLGDDDRIGPGELLDKARARK